jgi:ribosome-binding factor A
MIEETGKTLNLNQKDGQQIIELLTQAEGLLRDELRQHCNNSRSLDLQFLLEAQLNVSRALEALYDRASNDYTF